MVEATLSEDFLIYFSNEHVTCSVADVGWTAAIMSVLVVVAALGEMACPVVVGNVSLVSDVLLSREVQAHNKLNGY